MVVAVRIPVGVVAMVDYAAVVTTPPPSVNNLTHSDWLDGMSEDLLKLAFVRYSSFKPDKGRSVRKAYLEPGGV